MMAADTEAPEARADARMELMLRYLDGALSGAETGRLGALVRTNPEARREFARLLVQHGQLGEVALEATDGTREAGLVKRDGTLNPEPRLPATDYRPQAAAPGLGPSSFILHPSSPARRPFGSWSLYAAVTAAAALLAISFLYAFDILPSQSRTIYVSNTGDTAQEQKLPDGTRLSVAPGAAVEARGRVRERRVRQFIWLTAGEVEVEAPKATPGEIACRVETPDGLWVETVGTTFKVTRAWRNEEGGTNMDKTKLAGVLTAVLLVAVSEGEVRTGNAFGGEQRVAASQEARVDAAGNPEPNPVSQANVGKRITVEGVARDMKIGPAIVGEDFTLWVDGVHAWPAEVRDQRVRATGILTEDDGLPVFVPKEGEPIVQGIPVPEGTDLKQASHRFVLKDAKWERVEDAASSDQVQNEKLAELLKAIEAAEAELAANKADAKKYEAFILATQRYIAELLKCAEVAEKDSEARKARGAEAVRFIEAWFARHKDKAYGYGDGGDGEPPEGVKMWMWACLGRAYVEAGDIEKAVSEGFKKVREIDTDVPETEDARKWALDVQLRSMYREAEALYEWGVKTGEREYFERARSAIGYQFSKVAGTMLGIRAAILEGQTLNRLGEYELAMEKLKRALAQTAELAESKSDEKIYAADLKSRALTAISEVVTEMERRGLHVNAGAPEAGTAPAPDRPAGPIAAACANAPVVFVGKVVSAELEPTFWSGGFVSTRKVVYEVEQTLKGEARKQMTVGVIVVGGNPLLAAGKDGAREPRLDAQFFAASSRHVVCVESKSEVAALDKAGKPVLDASGTPKTEAAYRLERTIWPATEDNVRAAKAATADR